ncbi:hypothetical protein AGMMS49975_11880 [Clostridia bacterium]|nr:hypothetical protein AGMMS49975_11880 [Clostridia bacterium]
MGRKKKDNAVIDICIAEDEYNDELPDEMLLICHSCDVVMDYSAKLERFKCSCCGEEVAEDDYYEYDGGTPFGCRACGGPYPQCMTSCKMFDD